MKKIGFIDYYLDEWHANKYPDWIRAASGGTMEVAYAYGMKDAERGLSNAAWCGKHGIALRQTVEEVVAESDYLIVLSPDNPEHHEALAQLPLASGNRRTSTRPSPRIGRRRCACSSERPGTGRRCTPRRPCGSPRNTAKRSARESRQSAVGVPVDLRIIPFIRSNRSSR